MMTRNTLLALGLCLTTLVVHAEPLRIEAAPTSDALVARSKAGELALRAADIVPPLSEEELEQRFNTCDAVGFFGRYLEGLNPSAKTYILAACGPNSYFRKNHYKAFKALGGKDSDPISVYNLGLNIRIPQSAATAFCKLVGNLGAIGNSLLNERARNIFKTICCNPVDYPEATLDFVVGHNNAATTIGCKILKPAKHKMMEKEAEETSAAEMSDSEWAGPKITEIFD